MTPISKNVRAKIDFGELRALHNLGFALHWLQPKSKIPDRNGWSKGPRLSWEKFNADYSPGKNVGVRLGPASKIGELGTLAVIDVDVKDPASKAEAYKKLEELFPDYASYPQVLSGRGSGSAHYYVCVSENSKGGKLADSGQTARVVMPSVSPSETERRELTAAELDAGVRLRRSWSIELLADGRQAVLPGSVHPDTGALYKWGYGVPAIGDFAVVKLPAALKAIGADDPPPAFISTAFQPVKITDLGLSGEYAEALSVGTGVTDRSAMLFTLTLSMLRRGVPEAVIVSALTDPQFYLGRTAYDHAKTADRANAAHWFRKYTLETAKRELAKSTFDFQTPTADDWQKELDYQPGPRGAPPILRPTFKNVRAILQHETSPEVIGRNIFSNEDVWKQDTPWGNAAGKKRGNLDDNLRVKQWLIANFQLEVSVNTIEEALSLISVENSFHPVKDFLESLTWDGVPRVARAFEFYLGSAMDPKYLRPVCRKFFLALVSRIYEPGCKFDCFPVLEGKQGIGKSSFGKILVGEQWFIDGLPDFSDKDAALYLQGVWLCELAELSSLYRSTKETVKAFIARSTDKIRPPYGIRRLEFPRSSIFIGSTNDREYLVDDENRRSWPVQVTAVKFKALQRDRCQLLAEAKFLYDFFKEPLFLSGEAKALAEEFQHNRRVSDDSDEITGALYDWLEANPTKTQLRLKELFSDPLWTVSKNMTNYKSIGRALREAGFEKTRKAFGVVWIKTERLQ